MLKEEDPQTKDPKLQLNDSGISSEENQEAHSQWAEDKESLLSFFKMRLAPRTADIAVTSEDFHQEFQSDIQNHSTESRSVSLSDLSKILKSESFWHEISTMESEAGHAVPESCLRRSSRSMNNLSKESQPASSSSSYTNIPNKLRKISTSPQLFHPEAKL